MPEFRFIAATAANERREGLLEAGGVSEAAAELSRRGLLVIRITPRARHGSLWALLNQDVAFTAPISARERVSLTLEWANLLEAGVPLDEMLMLSATGVRRKGVRTIVTAIREAVKGGASLHEALKAHSRCFSPIYVALVQAGEAAGALGPALSRLARDLEAGQDFSARIRGALLYPAFLVVTATGAIVVLLTVVVPSLEAMVTERGSEALPFATRAVIATSHGLRDYGMPVAFVAVMAILGAVALFRLPSARRRFDRFVLGLPGLGSLARTADAGRYLRTLSALVAGGVALPRALPLAVPALRNRALAAALETAHAKVLVGAALGDALSESRTLPSDALVLARLGERTGRLAEALGHAAILLEKRLRLRLEAIATLIGPMLTLGFGLVAGLIVYAMLSTILGINELVR
ncbi:type II secretion system F family protein [Methylorubrum thiocyanatum]|uniref:type II secretion system F family protein n=1 Tax=Methylorubrum thiocyanatum TaxID=47958 RepID=UPI003F817A0B